MRRQLHHAQSLVDDCRAIADDPDIDLGDGRPGDAMIDADPYRRGRFRIDARLKVARIYFKRHEAVLARQMKEEELLVRLEEAELRAEAEAPEPAQAAAEPPARPAARADIGIAQSSAAIRLAVAPAGPEPIPRRADAAT